MKRRISMREIAAKVGVSHATVSMALRDNPRISAQRRAEIKGVAKELGFVPDPALRALSTYRKGKRQQAITSSIAWFNWWESESAFDLYREFALYREGALEALRDLGYRAESINVAQYANNPQRLQQVLNARGVRGILIPPHPKRFPLASFAWDEFSVVKFGFSVPEVDANLVTCDQYGAGLLAYESLQRIGYERAGYVGSWQNAANTRYHFASGFLAGAERDGRRRQIKPLYLDEAAADNFEAFARWYRKCRPDVIFSGYPQTTAYLRKLNVSVPDECGLAAHSILDGKINSGIDQHPREIGRVAARVLVSQIDQNEVGLPSISRVILVSGRWISGPELSLPRGDDQRQ